MARKSKYNRTLAAVICGRMAEGESVRSICRDPKMPAISSVFKWIGEHPEFSEQYTRALISRGDCLAEEMQEIADAPCADAVAVQRNRLRVETRKWLASKMSPKKYGDKLAIGGAEDLPPIKMMSNDALETKIAEIQAKLRGAP